jgi:KDO2-lipid IV(A) lauroyltransferase
MTRPVLARHPRLQRAVFAAARGLARAIPPHSARFVTTLAGTALWLGDAKGRRTVARNLAHFIPRACPDALARTTWRSYTTFCRNVYDTLRLDRLKPRDVAGERLVVVDPWGVFRHTPLTGPAILAIAHCHWELTPAVLDRRGLTNGLDALALRSTDPWIDAVFERMRGAVKVRSLWLGGAPLAALRALKSGKIVLMAADRDYSRSGLEVVFGGQSLCVPRGPAALAVQSGAPIIPLMLARPDPTRLMLVVGKPIRPHLHAPRNAQVADLTRILATELERFIAAAPGQWIAFHDAWQPTQTPTSALALTPLAAHRT